MAKLIEYFANGKGDRLIVSLDVTPSWWKRQKPGAFAIVASRIQKGFAIHQLHLGYDKLIVSTPLYKTEPLEPRVLELIQVLEELGGECVRAE